MPKRYSATNANLLLHALAPTMRRLIAIALDGTTVTYGELKTYLETSADFSTIFATRIGFVAGNMMDAILEADPGAPLLNVLVVNQVDRTPSHGAGGYMATRFGNSRLANPTYRNNHRSAGVHTLNEQPPRSTLIPRPNGKVSIDVHSGSRFPNARSSRSAFNGRRAARTTMVQAPGNTALVAKVNFTEHFAFGWRKILGCLIELMPGRNELIPNFHSTRATESMPSTI